MYLTDHSIFPTSCLFHSYSYPFIITDAYIQWFGITKQNSHFNPEVLIYLSINYWEINQLGFGAYSTSAPP